MSIGADTAAHYCERRAAARNVLGNDRSTRASCVDTARGRQYRRAAPSRAER